jgi:hypothetical protein
VEGFAPRAAFSAQGENNGKEKREARDYRPEHVFTLKQSLDGYRYYQKLIAELDREVPRLMHTLASALEAEQEIPQRTKHSAFQRQGNDPGFDLRGELYRIAGVDLNLTRKPSSKSVTSTPGDAQKMILRMPPRCLQWG